VPYGVDGRLDDGNVIYEPERPKGVGNDVDRGHEVEEGGHEEDERRRGHLSVGPTRPGHEEAQCRPEVGPDSVEGIGVGLQACVGVPDQKHHPKPATKDLAGGIEKGCCHFGAGWRWLYDEPWWG